MAVASGALPGADKLPAGAPPATVAAAAMAATAAAERPGGAVERQLEQAKASKEILLKQLIELSDQLAHAQADKAAAERKMTASLAAKDQELNRLAQAGSSPSPDHPGPLAATAHHRLSLPPPTTPA